jgi:hypothetical protein
MCEKHLAFVSLLMRYSCTAFSMTLLLLLGSCAGHADNSAGLTAQSVAINGNTTAAPQGVDAALWRQLCAELDRVLAQQATIRHTAGVPIGKGSVVPDLHTWSVVTNSVYEWSYRQHGDYDLNGTVNISDLVRVGMYFGRITLSADWQKAQLADGDGNGLIGIADVAAIGLNFNGRVDGYELQWRQTSSDPWVLLASAPFVAGDPATGLYPQYQEFTAFNAGGPDYRVVPYFDDGSGRQYGEQSNIIGLLSIQGTCWNTFRGNTAHDGGVLLYGPDSPDATWSCDLGTAGMLTYFNEPVSDYTGTIYIGTAPTASIATSDPGVFSAITLDGHLRWQFQTSRGICGAASCGIDGRVVVGDLSGMVYCLTPDGKQIWRRLLTGVCMLAAPLIDSHGNIYIVVHTAMGETITTSTLFKLDNTGAVLWSRDLGSRCLNSPFFDPEGDVAMVTDTGQLIAYQSDGSMWFLFDMGSIPDSLSFTQGVMIRGNMIYFSTDDKKIRKTAYDNSSSEFYDLGGETALTMPAMDMLGNLALGTTAAQIAKLSYFTGGVEVWQDTLPGNHLSNIALDLYDRMYLASCLLEQGDPGSSNGVHCVLPDQTKSWFYPTGEYYPMSLALVASKQLVCMALGASGARIISIKGN